MAGSLTDDVIETIRDAAKRLSGWRRREFQAEMAVKYCDRSARKAESVFGWRRDNVRTGLKERETGIRCVDNAAARGRKKTEDKTPRIAQVITQIVEPHAQADPKFQSAEAYTRITASRVRKELLEHPDLSEEDRQNIPTRQTVGEILNRMGYRLRRVQKARPQKNS